MCLFCEHQVQVISACFFPSIRFGGRLVGRSLFVCLSFNLILSSSSHESTQRLLFKRIKCIFERPLIRKNFVCSSTINSATIARTIIRSHVENLLVELLTQQQRKKRTEYRKQTKNVNINKQM